MWDLRGLDLKKLDIKGWDESNESGPQCSSCWTYRVGPEAQGAGPEAPSAGPGEQAPRPSKQPSRQPPALQEIARGELAEVLEQVIGRCVSRLGRAQEERLSEMFHEQHTLLETSLRRFQNQLAAHAASRAASSSAAPAAPAPSGASMTPAVANIDAALSRLANLVEGTQSDLDHYLARTKEAVSDAVGKKLDTDFAELLERLPTEHSPAERSPAEEPMGSSLAHQATMETAARQRMVQLQSRSVLHYDEQYPGEDEDEDEAPAPRSSLQGSGPMEWFRYANRARKTFLRNAIRESRRSLGPSKETWAQAVVRSEYFEMVSGFVIAVQVLLMAVETDRSFDRPFPLSTQIAIESLFLGIYTAELLARLGAERREFFASKLNVLDAFLVLAGCVDLISLLTVSDGMIQAGPLKALRILRLQKVLRLHRLFKLMPDAYVVLQSLSACGNALLGSALVVCVYLLVSAIVLGNTVSAFLRDEADALPDDEVAHYRRHFGSVSRCALTLYQSVTSGREWAGIYTALGRISEGYVEVAFLLFHFVFLFLIANILNSIYVQKVMYYSTEDTQVAHYNTYVRDRVDTQDLLRRCEAKFGAGDFMNYKEFLHLMADDHVYRLFDKRHIKFKEAKMVHATLAKPVPGQNSSDTWRHAVNRADFLEACMRLKHDHMVLDTVIANTVLRSHMEVLREQGDHLNSVMEQVEKKIDAMKHRTNTLQHSMPLPF